MTKTGIEAVISAKCLKSAEIKDEYALEIVFGAVILKDTSTLNPMTLICSATVVLCGILAATDIKTIFELKP